MSDYYSKNIPEVLEELKSGENGLSEGEAKKRFEEFGPNKLPEAKPDNLFVIFLRQFQSPLIYILLAAASIVFYLGDIVDGLIILAVLVFNAIVGAFQEGKAQNTLLAIKKFAETKATVLREGKETIMPDYEIVVGDVIILQEGERAPADARIIFSNNLKVDQSSLTGESIPVLKTNEAVNRKNLSVIDQQNMVFRGTYIVGGNGQAIVTATGLNSEIGKIGKEISLIDTEIPLKKDIRQLSRAIIITAAVIGVVLFFSGIFFGKTLIEMFKTVVALSVSIIPAGLPVAITLVLATGVWRMAKRNALIKRLQAVEALGQAKIIALDKTGTITKNELMIRKVFIYSKNPEQNKVFEIGGAGYEPRGEIYFDNQLISAPDFKELILAGKIAAFCSNGRVFYSEEEKNYKIAGDPTEAAIMVFAQKVGFQKEIVEKQHPLLYEIPFDYENKYRAVVRKTDENKKFLAVIGAPESVFNICKLSKKEKEELGGILEKMSSGGLRVLSFACADKKIPEILKPEEMSGLVFGGFYGMKDILRQEAKEAIKKTKESGIRVIMITGDNKLTAKAIAEEAGIYEPGDEILTDKDIKELSAGELNQKLDKTSVFARITPDNKLKIIQLFKEKGKIIAMTGDGVNDASSLVAADLGVSMGKIGTEVAKEAGDIVILDDNFESIVSAIEEGRNIYKTIKKVILYLFSTSLGEVLTICAALFSGYPLPLLASQIIWLNFVTDGFLVVALAMEPREKNLLKNKWKKGKHFIDFIMVQRMLIMAGSMVFGAFLIFRHYLDFDFSKALTMSLTTLAIFQWFNVWNCRSENESIFRRNPFSNKWLLFMMPVVVLLQLLAVYHPFMQKILHTTALEFSDWLIAVGAAFSIIIIEEIRKLLYRNPKP